MRISDWSSDVCASDLLKPWQKQEWCIPTIDADYVCRMEEVLELYADPLDLKRPVVCFDETPYQLIAESRPSVPMQPSQSLRVDYEYVRQGRSEERRVGKE